MNFTPKRPRIALLLAACLGCAPSGGKRIEAPALSPGDAAAAAIAEFDTNKDGFLDAKELERCPGLLSAFDDLDENKDKKLSADEIKARLESYRKSNVGIMTVPCRVTLDGRPLSGASIQFIPESFLGSSFKPASGVSDATGNVELKAEGYDVPGLPCGFYRVEVRKEGGREKLPARYHSPTTLGQEISPSMRGEVHLKLKSR